MKQKACHFCFKPINNRKTKFCSFRHQRGFKDVTKSPFTDMYYFMDLVDNKWNACFKFRYNWKLATDLERERLNYIINHFC